MTTDLDVYNSGEIVSAVRLLISSVNVCNADTISAAAKTVREDANNHYYDEQDILHNIADFIESKLSGS